ncbi:MAG: M20/M25/M40 family metallo-hydrolase [Eubacteriales bacterium]|nr:M20/M25/M40 family metallo-hydrolase [Eubacteriales bacterium]
MIVLWLLLGLIALLMITILIRTLRFRPLTEEPIAPVKTEADADEAARNLSALVRCRTVSHADSALDDEKEFIGLIALLPELFPNVYRVCGHEAVGSRGLLFRWKGSTDAAPLVLTAHYDVVPADERQWERPPFSGEIAEGMIHGRGTLDTKCTLSAVLTAAETLIKQGFTPARDVYFCFGGNEEVMGDGAARIVDTLEKRGVKPLMVVDEGGAIVTNVFPGVSQPCALIGVAEKGSVNYRLGAHAKGGHSSAPPSRTPVDRLAQACVDLRRKPFPFRTVKPALMLLNGLARYSTFAYRMIFANLWAFGPLLDAICRKSGGELNALFRTTVAYTVFHAGESANVLPADAEMTINVRVLPGESIEGTLVALHKKVRDPQTDITLLRGQGPSACSGTDGVGYALLRRTIGETYPGTLVSPYLMIAGSDARFYERICSHVYRFSGMALTAEERKMIHGANEQIPVSKQADTVRFFMRLMQNGCGSE